MLINRDLWFKQITNDYPNVPHYVINWMLDIYDKDPNYFKEQLKKTRKGPHRKDSLKTTLTNLNNIAQGPVLPPVDKNYELQNVEVKFAESNTTKADKILPANTVTFD